ncbi:MAG TPA: retropepsin-like aspartic protease [Kofleriaceae bacterium]
MIYVDATVYGPRGGKRIRLALDTAATLTQLTPTVVSAIGYTALDSHGPASVQSAVGRERGYRLYVGRFESLGFGFPCFEVFVNRLGGVARDMDGLLGLNFLRSFNYEVRSIEGRILVERAA